MAGIVLKYPENLLYMLIPFLLLILMLLGIRKKVRILSRMQLNGHMKFAWVRIILMVSGLVMICFALLGPANLEGTLEVKYESLDIYVLLDTSKSMLVEDIAPSRLKMEKLIVNQILSKLEGDRIGFIPFSSTAYIQMPLTDDYGLAQMFLKVVDTDMISGGGSDIGKAIEIAYDSFDRSTEGNQVLLIISDGEEHDNNTEETLEDLMDDRLRVYTIGIGTSLGGPIPLADSDGTFSYKEDEGGNMIISKLNDEMLEELSVTGNGQYYAAMNETVAETFLADISTLKKNNAKTKNIKHYKELYQYFLGAGMAIFLLATLIPVRRQKI